MPILWGFFFYVTFCAIVPKLYFLLCTFYTFQRAKLTYFPSKRKNLHDYRQFPCHNPDFPIVEKLCRMHLIFLSHGCRMDGVRGSTNLIVCSCIPQKNVRLIWTQHPNSRHLSRCILRNSAIDFVLSESGGNKIKIKCYIGHTNCPNEMQ